MTKLFVQEQKKNSTRKMLNAFMSCDLQNVFTFTIQFELHDLDLWFI